MVVHGKRKKQIDLGDWLRDLRLGADEEKFAAIFNEWGIVGIDDVRSMACDAELMADLKEKLEEVLILSPKLL